MPQFVRVGFWLRLLRLLLHSSSSHMARIGSRNRCVSSSLPVPSTPSDGTITRLVQSRGGARRPCVCSRTHARTHAPKSCALVETSEKRLPCCLSCLSWDPRLHRIRELCDPSSRLTTVPRTHWICYHVLQPLPRVCTPIPPQNGIKDRFELVCGSVHQANARLTLYTSSPWGGFSDLQGPVVEGVTSKEYPLGT